MMIEVVYAGVNLQKLLALEVDDSCTARRAALASGLDHYFPGLDLARVPIGVFGEVVRDDHILAPGDRVELYRELIIDPMQARRRRAARS